MLDSVSDFLVRGEKKYGDRLALHLKRVFRLEKVSYRQLLESARKMGRFLRQQNLQAGDRVAIWAPNSPAWVVAYFGCLAHGLVVVPADVHSSPALVGKYIKETKAKLLFTSTFFTARPRIKAVELENLLDDLAKLAPIKFPAIKADALAEIIYTSGTTGKPKGVQITQGNIVAALNILVPAMPQAKEYRVLSILPLSHIMEQIVGLLATLYYGATIYYLPAPNALSIKKSLKKYQVTHLGLVPQVLRLLWEAVELEAEKQGRLGQLQTGLKLAPLLPFRWRRGLFRRLHTALGGNLAILGCGSAPLDIEAAENWEKVGIRVLEGYGASETTGGVTVNTEAERKLGSVGKVLPGVGVKLSESGEILVKGPMVTSGYYHRPELNQESFTAEGYFKTGDVGRFDRQGFLYITGREKFRIVTPAGDKIYPEEVEQIVNRHPQVSASCVLGIPVAGGEAVALALVLKRGATVDKVFADLKTKLESKQWPTQVKVWPDKDFPRTHTLKVDRRQVKEWFLETKTTGKQAKAEIREDKLVTLLARVAGFGLAGIKETDSLQAALQLDSLKRATLAAFLEQEFGVELEEADLGKPELTLSKLRQLLRQGGTVRPEVEFPSWPRSERAVAIREQLRRRVLFPVIDHFAVKINIDGQEYLEQIANPSILISNHVGNFDLTLILRILPEPIRRRLFAVADSDHYRNPTRAQLFYWFGNTYAMVKDGSRAKAELDFITDLVDQGWTLMITPEGEYGEKERMQAFRLGTALLAVETGAPVVPFKIEHFDRIYKSVKKFPYWPDGQGEVTVKVGPPVTFGHATKYEAAAATMKRMIEAL